MEMGFDFWDSDCDGFIRIDGIDGKMFVGTKVGSMMDGHLR